MIYELINPSDDWSFEAPSDKIAFLVSLIVGEGQTPASRDGWQGGMYILGLGDPNKDFQEQFNEQLEGAFTRHKTEIVESLKSFVIKRKEAPTGMTLNELRTWNDKHRSSLNDWGGYAHELADRIKV